MSASLTGRPRPSFALSTWRRSYFSYPARRHKPDQQQVGHLTGNLRAGQAPFRREPSRHPIDGAHEGKHRELRINAAHRTVLYACLDDRHEVLLECTSSLCDALAVLRPERVDLHQDAAGTQLFREHLDVAAQCCLQNLCASALMFFREVESPVSYVERHFMTLEEDLLLVLDIVVQRPLGNLQHLGDLIERGVVVPALAERKPGLLDDGGAFDALDMVVGLDIVLPARHRVLRGVDSGGKASRVDPPGQLNDFVVHRANHPTDETNVAQLRHAN
jgi:hypothetical protein